MSIFEKIKAEYKKYVMYKKFEKAIKENRSFIKRLDIEYDKELGITRNIIKLAYKYNLPIIVNDNKMAHKQYLSRTWFNYDLKFIKLSDALDINSSNEIVPMALCDLDDARYEQVKDLRDLWRAAAIVIGAAKI